MNILPGKIAYLEMMYGVYNANNHMTLNNELGINYTGLDNTIDQFKGRVTQWLCIGDDGTTDNSSAIARIPRQYETRLYGLKPIRLRPTGVGNDLEADERAKYGLRKIITIAGSEYIAYYAKKLNDPDILLKTVDGLLNETQLSSNATDYIIDSADSVPVEPGSEELHPRYNKPVFAFHEITLNINGDEYKEYYRAQNNNSLIGANITEFGLIIAKEKTITVSGDIAGIGGGDLTYNELEGAEVFAKMCTTPKYLDTPMASTTLKYNSFA